MLGLERNRRKLFFKTRRIILLSNLSANSKRKVMFIQFFAAKFEVSLRMQSPLSLCDSQKKPPACGYLAPNFAESR